MTAVQPDFCEQECADDFATDYWRSRQRASASCCGAEGAAIPPHTRPPETRPAECCIPCEETAGSAGPFASGKAPDWTEEETEALRHILTGNVSASQAARAFTTLCRPVTKNAVIGKCNRLGIALPLACGPRWHPAEPTPNHFPDARGCLWPIGHPNDPQFHFCGQKRRAPNQPYCPVHAAKAYVKADKVVA